MAVIDMACLLCGESIKTEHVEAVVAFDLEHRDLHAETTEEGR